MRYIQYYKDMREITGESNSTFFWYTVLNIIEEGAFLLPPIAISEIIGVLTRGGEIGEVLKWAILYLVFWVLYSIPRYIVYEYYAAIAKKFHILLQEKLINHVIANDKIFSEISKGKIISTCSDDVREVVDVIDCSGMAIAKIVKLVVIFVIFAINNVWVAIMVALVDALYMVLMAKNSRKYAKHFDGCRKYEDKTTEVVNQTVTNFEQIKIMELLPAMLKRYRTYAKKWAEQYIARRRDRRRLYVEDDWIAYVGRAALYVTLGFLVVNGNMTVAVLVLLASYFDQTITSTNELWRDCLRALSEYGVKTQRVKRVLSCTQKSEVEFGDIDNDYITGLVEFKNVSLVKDGKKILNKVSFKARPNEITAIVGPKGAGKTSVVNLLHRSNKLTSGMILIDGENIYNYSRKVHNSNVSGVFQKPFVIDASIRENLALVNADHRKQVEACDRVGFTEVIRKLKNGYNTVVTSDESVMAEGDKQLLAVTRAVLTRAEILIFDEVSSVGAQAIPNLAEILEDLKQDHTIILVTHEKDLIKKADRVIEMEQGKVVKS